jgi:hypothetical protein
MPSIKIRCGNGLQNGQVLAGRVVDTSVVRLQSERSSAAD